MIELGIIIGGAIAFHKYAKENGLVVWLWSIIPILSYFVAAFIAGLFIGLFAPNLLSDQLWLTIIALSAGILGVGIAYFIMTKEAAKKRSNNNATSDLLDNDLID